MLPLKGGVAEWLMAHAWKACLQECDEGKKPSPSLKLKTGCYMSKQRLYLDDIYENEHCEGSIFRAVVMMSYEARFLNDQHRMKFIELHMKPTSLAMKKFQDNKLEYTKDENSHSTVHASYEYGDFGD